ncbi:hypothetical protein B0H12DRAFT_1161342 [Mycena haematopus]|nr:hypothetical protein B0H12DRAFT_1161342 [Mycena haematopus]
MASDIPRFNLRSTDMAAVSLEDYKTVFTTGGEKDYSPFFVFYINRALAGANAEALRTSGNRAYNTLLYDHQRALEELSILQAEYWAVISAISNACHSASTQFREIRTRHHVFPSPAWDVHPYGQPPFFPDYIPPPPFPLPSGSRQAPENNTSSNVRTVFYSSTV